MGRSEAPALGGGGVCILRASVAPGCVGFEHRASSAKGAYGMHTPPPFGYSSTDPDGHWPTALPATTFSTMAWWPWLRTRPASRLDRSDLVS